MDIRTNIVFMMTLGAGIVALGGSIVAGEIIGGERPEKMGYVVEGVEAEAGAEAEVAHGVGSVVDIAGRRPPRRTGDPGQFAGGVDVAPVSIGPLLLGHPPRDHEANALADVHRVVADTFVVAADHGHLHRALQVQVHLGMRSEDGLHVRDLELVEAVVDVIES